MKKNHFYTMFIISNIFFSTSVFALSYTCPNTYRTVTTGNSSQQVAQACGQPTSVSTQTSQSNVPVNSVQWVYTIQPGNNVNVQVPGGNIQIGNNATQVNSTAPQMIITFDNDTVTQIANNNQGTTPLFNCFRFNRISVGSAMSQVRQQCGSPNNVNTVTQSSSQQVTVTTWTYSFGPSTPSIIFTFQNDALSDIKTGQMP